MLLMKNVSLRDRTRFMEVNIRANLDRAALAQLCGTLDPALVDGLLAFRSLLARIYAAPELLEGKDDERKFHGLI